MGKRDRTATTVFDIMPCFRGREKACARRAWWLPLVLLLLFCKPGSARDSQEVQFLPELDAYLKLNSKLRLSAQAKDTREGETLPRPR